TAGLWVVNRDGSNPRCRTQGCIGNVGLRVHHDMPTWSTSQNNVFAVADAQHVYATVARHGCAEIWRVALEGPIHCETVVSGQRSNLIMDVRAAAEAQLLYCTSDLNTPWELCQSDLHGSGERRLTQLNDSILATWPALKVHHLSFSSS